MTNKSHLLIGQRCVLSIFRFGGGSGGGSGGGGGSIDGVGGGREISWDDPLFKASSIFSFIEKA